MIQKLSQNIPLSRLMMYFVIVGLLPLAYIGFNYSKRVGELDAISNELYTLQKISSTQARKQHLNNLVRDKYKEADHYYIDHQLETMTFLETEKNTLEKLIRNPSFTGNEEVERRYGFIAGKANRLLLAEGSVQKGEGIVETTELLVHPIEVNIEDLGHLLSCIEGSQAQMPQLFFTDFKLQKKNTLAKNEVFEVSFKLLKREFEGS